MVSLYMKQELINYIYDKFGIEILSFKKITIGYINDVYHLKTKNDDIILKIYNISDEFQIELSISIQRFMNKNGLSPKIIADDTLERKFVLQEYFPLNKKTNISWQNYGENLGLLHKCLKQYNEISVEKFNPDSISTIFDNTLLSEDKIRLLLLKREMFLMFNHPELEKIQLIHGDYTWNNVLYNNNIVYTIDFDQSKNYYPLYDISKVLFNIFFTHNLNKDMWNNIIDFIVGYENVNEITNEEKKELFNVYGYTLSHDMSGIYDYYNKDPNYLKKRINLHKKMILCYKEKDEIMRRLNW